MLTASILFGPNVAEEVMVGHRGRRAGGQVRSSEARGDGKMAGPGGKRAA